MNDYKKEYLDTCDTINKKIIEKWPNVGADGGSPLSWAKDNAPDLYKQEEKLDARINTIWQNAGDCTCLPPEKSSPSALAEAQSVRGGGRIGTVPDPTFADFKKTVIEWARTILKIYKKYSESIEAGSMLSESASLPASQIVGAD